MSDSPPKNEQETEQGAQSGEEPDQMDREQEGVQQGLGDFEVKEQDRWLPIANGWFCLNLRFRFWLYLICASLA
jgi:nuclear transcription Y subunit beta